MYCVYINVYIWLCLLLCCTPQWSATILYKWYLCTHMLSPRQDQAVLSGAPPPMWLWVNKALPGSPGCSDMFRPRRSDSCSLSNACRVNGWRIRSAVYFHTKMTLKRWRESDCVHTNLILSLLIQTWVTFERLNISHDQTSAFHLLYLFYSWGSCLVDPPPLPSLLIPSFNLRNPHSMANRCCFQP